MLDYFLLYTLILHVWFKKWVFAVYFLTAVQ